MAYSFEQVFAADPSNPANVARNAAVTIFAPGDVAQTPLTLTTPNGDPLANPLQVNNNGFGSAFMHATLDRVAWSGGNFTGFFTSYEGMKAEAVSARTAAQTAAATAGADAAAVATAAIGTATDDAEAAATSAATAASNASASATAAANSAALVGAPADAAIAAAINGSGTATKTALSATYATPATVNTAVTGYDTANAGGYASVGARVAAIGADAPFATVPAQNITLATKLKWRKALGKVNSGTGNAKLLVVGDSTSWGIGSGGADGGAWPRTLSTMLNRMYAPTQYSFIVPPGSSAPTTSPERDDRWNNYVAAGWSDAAWGFGGGGAIIHPGTATSSALTVTPGINCDTFEVYYLTNGGLGSIAVSVDGGTVTNQSTAAALGWGKVTVTAAAASNHVLSIVKSANTVFILGVNAYLSTQPSIHVMNAGISNSRAYAPSGSQWGDATNGQSRQGIKLIAPDLTVIQLGINDARLANSSSVANWEASIRGIIADAQISGDTILASVIPSSTATLQNAGAGPGTAAALEQAYRDRCLTIATETGSGFIDIFNRYGSYTAANTAGYMADGLHTTAPGSADVAEAYRRVITA